MARNRQILKLLEIGERFSFNYWQKISKGCQFIRCGNERMAIVRRDVKRKIKPCDNHLYEKWMAGEIKEEDLRYDFCYERHNQLIVPDVLGLSTFTDKKRMPPHLTMKPERLWQLDPESRFPDELEIFVPQDRDFKGYIRIKKGTQVDKDKLIEMLGCLPWRKCPK